MKSLIFFYLAALAINCVMCTFPQEEEVEKKEVKVPVISYPTSYYYPYHYYPYPSSYYKPAASYAYSYVRASQVNDHGNGLIFLDPDFRPTLWDNAML
ncbi:hypothetical protein JTE90_025429 [Oedothorax gibbosus]|uniref:Uncharacterized protein n=1 Tax=Oedothorax gibbosus TaxID=931172 RepID=A0AAV6U8J5_9ARAC|nr:hypothetical protein JTE90_025429 [Oedothorax gibbosus]